jgi:hypothetical protein
LPITISKTLDRLTQMSRAATTSIAPVELSGVSVVDDVGVAGDECDDGDVGVTGVSVSPDS